MKKRTIILIIISIFLLTVAGFALQYTTSHHTVTFDIKNGEYKIKVLASDDKQVGELSAPGGQLWLQKGEYTYAVTDTKYDTSVHNFSVASKDQSITVDPDYSSDYLGSLLAESEQQDITSALAPYTGKVNATLYSIESLKLFGRGEWAAGKLAYQPTKRDIAENYRFVLHKENNTWKVTVPPQIAIYSGDYPTVPKYVLESLYSAN